MSFNLMNAQTAQDWIDMYVKLVNWEMELDEHGGLGLAQTLTDQKREMNSEFGKFFERNYKRWCDTIYTSDNAANRDRKSTRLNSSHRCISYAVFCLKKKKKTKKQKI